jgi:phosphatidylinositol-3-phosphatase
MSNRFFNSWSSTLFLLLNALSGFTSSCGGGGGSAGPSDIRSGRIPVVSHVFVLVEENHSYESVIGNPSMPFTNTLAQRYALATQYFANRHNSLPNYFMLTVGDLVCTDDAFKEIVEDDNVVRALAAANKTWKIYAESLPRAGYTGKGERPYAKDHNPFAYIRDVLKSREEMANIVPMTQLSVDLNNGNLPNYAMIVPNLANDGHDCPIGKKDCSDEDKLANIDLWVKTNLGPLIDAMQDSVLIYTWDESDSEDRSHEGGHIATILIGSKVRAGYQSTIFYQHQNALKLTMQLLGVTDFPGAAATAADMTEFF